LLNFRDRTPRALTAGRRAPLKCTIKNYLSTYRLYNIALKNGPKLFKIFNIGPKPTGLLAGKTLLDSLGDTAVDFTSTPDGEHLLILRGNGDVYMMQCNLDGKE
jgi:hypothetical protein